MRYVTIAYYIVLNVTMCLSNNQIKLCLQQIAEEYFIDDVVLIIFWKEEREPFKIKKLLGGSRRGNVLTSIVQTLSKTEKWTVKIHEGDHPKTIFNLKDKVMNDNVIIILSRRVVSNPEKLKQKLKESKDNTYWESQCQLIIIMRAIPQESSFNSAKKVIETLWISMKAANVLIVMLDGSSFLFFKWRPYTEDCGTVNNVKLINEWKDGRFIKNHPLFSKLSTDLNGCELMVGTISRPPYVLEPTEPNNYTDGLEIRLLLSLAQYFNFKVKYITLPEGISPYIIYLNGKPSGYHEMLVKQELDLMLFGVRINDLRNQIADPMDSYFEDALVWVVPTPTPKSYWTSIRDVFSWECWLLIVTFLILLSGTMFLLGNFQVEACEDRRFRKFSSCLFMSVGVILNNAVLQPKTALLRLVMFMFSFFAITLTGAYQSSLITLLTNKRYNKVYKTPMEAVQGGVVTYLFPSAKNTYNQTDFAMWNIILQPDRHVFSEDYMTTLRKIATNKSAMILMTEIPARYEINTRFTTRRTKEPQILILKEKFSYYKVTAYMSLGHPMRDHFRRKINQLKEGGIIGQWLKEILSHSKKETMKDYETKKRLTIFHLEGAFLVLAVLLSVSFLVFCGEIVFYKVQNRFSFIKHKKF